MSNWKTVRLGDVLNFKRGHDLPKYDMKDGEIPVAGSNGIIGYHNVATNISPCITIGRSGNVGTPYMYEKCWAHNTTLYIDDYKENDPKYIFYLLKTLNLGNYGGGSAVPTLNRNHIHPIDVFYTSDLDEQRRIAGILGALDDKIECNNRINRNLEEQAAVLFRRWFVDFEFPDPDPTSPTYGKPYRSAVGTMQDSPLGSIPQGWQVGTLGDNIDTIDNRGKTPPLENSITNFPIIDVKALASSSRTIDYNSCTKYVNKETYNNWFRNGHPKQYDILISTVGSLAEMKLFYGCKGCIAQNVVGFRAKNISPLYLFEYLRYIKNDLISYNIGSVQPSIKVTHIIKHNIIIPQIVIVYKFEAIINEITSQIHCNEIENQNLATLRDTLLPKLMNNQIKI